MPKLAERAAAALEAPFVRALAKAAGALDAKVDMSTIAPWFAEGGIVGAHLGRVRSVVRGILAREAAVLEALVDGACRGGDA
jgi:hypothetical protein